jgi:2C-methyl-D-erythritol 2,4-cyclodiphosphate synthase
MRDFTTPMRVGLDGLLEAVFALAAEDEWKLQKARLRVVGREADIERYESLIRKEIGHMLVAELHEYPATYTRTKELREQTFARIMGKMTEAE